MPRIGRHPLKQQGLKDDVSHEKITVATIVHIPVLSGYWENSLEVLQLFFESLFASTDLPYDLMVFDNNSCVEVQDYLLSLKRNDKIQYLTLSRYNLRKLGALNYLLSTAPGEYVSFADSDVYFLSGWLEASLEILKAFPEAGKVTAQPIVGGDTSKIDENVFEQAALDGTISIQTGHLVSKENIDAHRMSLGQSQSQYSSRLKDRKDVLLSRNGVQAFLSGADFQFTTTQKAICAALPLTITDDKDYYDPIYSPVLEKRLKESGFWLLSSPLYLVHHMGNTVPNLDAELPWLTGIEGKKSVKSVEKSSNNSKSRLLQNRFVRRFLKFINVHTYKLLYE